MAINGISNTLSNPLARTVKGGMHGLSRPSVDREVRFSGAETDAGAPASKKGFWKSMSLRAKLGLATILGMAGAGTGVAIINTPPAQCVGEARETGWQGRLGPEAYITRDRKIIHPLLRMEIGHITPEGKAVGLFGKPRGEGGLAGGIYGPDGKTVLGHIDLDGTVRALKIQGPVVTPDIIQPPSVEVVTEGKIISQGLSLKEKAAFAAFSDLVDVSAPPAKDAGK